MESLLAPLLGFKEQFSFTPKIGNFDALKKYDTAIICGMGGSAISVSLLTLIFPDLSVSLHNSYGLPEKFNKENTLIILNSYSGNTEETLDGFNVGIYTGAHLAIVSRGGTLLDKAKEFSLPYVKIPDSDLEPRFSIGYQLIALLSLLQEHEKITILKEAIHHVNMSHVHDAGKDLAENFFKDTYPVLYSSSHFYPVTYLIKAAINEGAKIPCFANIIPEANHNELQSYVTDDRRASTKFAFLFIASDHDHERILKRFHVMDQIYQEKDFTTYIKRGNHKNITGVFEMILTGYYMATYLAIHNTVDSYKTPLIQEFKKRMAH